MQRYQLQTAAVDVQAAVVVDEHHEQVPRMVRGAGEHVPDALRRLVLVPAEPAQTNVLGREQHRLPAVEGVPVVLGEGVHVALRKVEQLGDGRVLDGVAPLLRRCVEDAERPDLGLLQNVGRRGAAEDTKVGRAAQLAKDLDLKGVACPFNYVRTKIRLETMAVNQLLEITIDDIEFTLYLCITQNYFYINIINFTKFVYTPLPDLRSERSLEDTILCPTVIAMSY